jgi:starch-binding outer membrane protein, SusD/RagB family
MKKILYNIGAFFFTALLCLSCTDLDEEVFSSVVGSNFYQSKSDIYSALSLPYQRVADGNTDEFFLHNTTTLNEITADLISLPQKWVGWEEGGIYHRLHRHTWTPSESTIYEAWSNVFKSIGYCNNALEDFNSLDYSEFGLTEDDKKLHLAELTVLRAFFQLRALDAWGSIPISKSTDEVVGNSTKQENFDFIQESILDNINTLPKAPDADDGRFTQGTAAFILMRLYFNAKQYIGKEMFSETKQLAQDIIDGKYGAYALDNDWNTEFCAENNLSTGLIFMIPQAQNQNFNAYFFNAYQVFNNTQAIWNSYTGYSTYANCALGLCPSRNSMGEMYSYKLGNAYERFSDKDMRKRQHVIDDNEINGYTGLFMVGPQYKYHTTERMDGIIEWDGISGMFFNDQCSTYGFSISDMDEKQKLMDDAYTSDLTYFRYDKLLASDNSTQEFTGGVRLCKTPIYPDDDARVATSGDPQMRLEEVYFTLAECKFREGDIQGCVNLINQVRERAFAIADRESGKLISTEFDKYALLREWGCEFLGEGRRRTDLIRNNVFLEDEWWDKAANTASYREFFPIPLEAINSNPLLEKTPGYTY